MGKLLEPFGSWLFMAIFVNIPKNIEYFKAIERYFAVNEYFEKIF